MMWKPFLAVLLTALILQTSARRLHQKRTEREIHENKLQRAVGAYGNGNYNPGFSNLDFSWTNLLGALGSAFGSASSFDFTGKGRCPDLSGKGLRLVRLANNRVYYFQTTEEVGFGTAKKRCEELGMHLVTMETFREFRLVVDYLFSHRETETNYNVWIGLVDSDGSTDTTPFHWITTGLAPSYNAWYDTPSELCAVIDYDMNSQADDIGWDSEDCTNVNLYMCEMEPPCDKYVNAAFIPYTHRNK